MTVPLFGRSRQRMWGVAWLVLSFAAASLYAKDRPGKDISVGPAAFRGSKVSAAAAVPKEQPAAADLARAAARLPASARHALGPLSAGERATFSGDGAGRGREKARVVGVVRKLEGATEGFVDNRGARTIWTAAFVSNVAAGIRLRVEAAGLPDGSRAYIYAAGGTQIHGPYSAAMLARSGGFWTNTVFADEAFLEVALPDGASMPRASRIRVSAVAHLDRERAFPRGTAKESSGAPPEDCPLDLQCVSLADFPLKNEASRAVAMIYYEGQGFLGQCTGALLNTTVGPIAPYLLTANHCFSTQASAASVEAFWSYVTPSCGALPPDPATFQSSLGATLLATESAINGADYTFLLLDEDPPDDSIFLGWTTEDLAPGTPLHRISHPEGLPQSYSHNEIAPFLSDCTEMQADEDWPSIIDRGMTLGGSSGASLMTDDLEVVGQLWGGCGLCGTPIPQTRDNDGRFSESFAALAQYLDPDTPAPCTPGPTTLCLNGGRFRVEADWRRVNGDTGLGQAVPLTSDSGYFWFFNSANIELVVKVLNACSVNDHYWVFAGGLTNVEVVLTVTDTNTGAQRVYNNPLGTAFEPLQDTGAFDCP
jgi:hypothetical protein